MKVCIGYFIKFFVASLPLHMILYYYIVIIGNFMGILWVTSWVMEHLCIESVNANS
jgi:F0F1-type ATP synthase assembly protein I